MWKKNYNLNFIQKYHLYHFWIHLSFLILCDLGIILVQIYSSHTKMIIFLLIFLEELNRSNSKHFKFSQSSQYCQQVWYTHFLSNFWNVENFTPWPKFGLCLCSTKPWCFDFYMNSWRYFTTKYSWKWVLTHGDLLNWYHHSNHC
jgi:hypothetical protein